MNKTSTILGITTMIIGIGFGIADLTSSSINNVFLVSALIWTFGGIAVIFGITIFEKEGMQV